MILYHIILYYIRLYYIIIYCIILYYIILYYIIIYIHMSIYTYIYRYKHPQSSGSVTSNHGAHLSQSTWSSCTGSLTNQVSARSMSLRCAQASEFDLDIPWAKKAAASSSSPPPPSSSSSMSRPPLCLNCMFTMFWSLDQIWNWVFAAFHASSYWPKNCCQKERQIADLETIAKSLWKPPAVSLSCSWKTQFVAPWLPMINWEHANNHSSKSLPPSTSASEVYAVSRPIPVAGLPNINDAVVAEGICLHSSSQHFFQPHLLSTSRNVQEGGYNHEIHQMILYYIILCYIMLYYVILCYIMWYYVIWYKWSPTIATQKKEKQLAWPLCHYFSLWLFCIEPHPLDRRRGTALLTRPFCAQALMTLL